MVRASCDLNIVQFFCPGTLGQLLAIKVRCYEYNWVCAVMKKDPPKFLKPDSNTWKLVPDERITYSERAAAVAVEARSLLKRVVYDYPGTPGATVAQRELNHTIGFRWVETFVKPAPTDAKKKTMAGDVGIRHFTNYQSCGGFWPPSLRGRFELHLIRTEVNWGTDPVSESN